MEKFSLFSGLLGCSGHLCVWLRGGRRTTVARSLAFGWLRLVHLFRSLARKNNCCPTDSRTAPLTDARLAATLRRSVAHTDKRAEKSPLTVSVVVAVAMVGAAAAASVAGKATVRTTANTRRWPAGFAPAWSSASSSSPLLLLFSSPSALLRHNQEQERTSGGAVEEVARRLTTRETRALLACNMSASSCAAAAAAAAAFASSEAHNKLPQFARAQAHTCFGAKARVRAAPAAAARRGSSFFSPHRVRFLPSRRTLAHFAHGGACSLLRGQQQQRRHGQVDSEPATVILEERLRAMISRPRAKLTDACPWPRRRSRLCRRFEKSEIQEARTGRPSSLAGRLARNSQWPKPLTNERSLHRGAPLLMPSSSSPPFCFLHST